MPTDHKLNNYTFREQDSGELKIQHDTDGDVATYDPSTGTFTSDKPFETDDIVLNDEWYYAADDAALDNVLTQVGEGDAIILGNSDFSKNRTVTTDGLEFKGTSRETRGAVISGTWDFSAARATTFKQISRISGTLTVDSLSLVSDCEAFGGEIIVSGSTVVIHGLAQGTVTFQSGTSSGIVDASALVSVTDNGSNTVGDIA